MNFADRLTTEDWLRVFREAERLGVLQVNLSGGEPLLRGDLIALIRGASESNLYSNLITSGIPLHRDKLSALRDAGVNSVQVSIQDTNQEQSDRIAGKTSFEKKLQAARWVKEFGLPLTLNFVLHRNNLDRVAEIVELAEELQADRLELANTQYLAWALINRRQLLPSRDQLTKARRCAISARERLKGKMEILFVLPDYYSDLPKACMSGWGRHYIVVTPDGLAMPCHLAHTIRSLTFDNVLDSSLAEIWHNSAAFEAFRGSDWLPEPCRSCDRQSIDFGGCRCQAFQLTGDARVTDPACSLSPDHSVILAA
jgi:pyrroloquinoline quinone biosynthesis protein E